MLEEIHAIDDFKKIEKRHLPQLAAEIRERIIEVMKKNGGHLASNLGTVELIMAIHYVFESPLDKIIFDVGHQSYTHKLLTGRNEQFPTIRTGGGLSGFTRRSESVHDHFDSGHASSSISQATGLAQALKLSGDPHRVVTLIGDGALTGGEAYEGLNYCGHTGLPVIVVLNDNEMSIGSNVGAISRYINKIAVSRIYQHITEDLEKSLKSTKNPLKGLIYFINRIKKGYQMLFDYENVFTGFGFEYIGPINGHDLNEMIHIFSQVKKNINRPVLLHVKTIKGKGFTQAEGDPSKFHGVTPYLMNTGKSEVKTEKTFTDIFADKITDMGGEHRDILAITAAMESGTGLSQFHLNYPERFYDVGITEQHAVSFAAALSYGGYRPFVAIYSTFLMRAIDQINQDVCISNSPVIFMVDRAGVVGADGETHHGQFDLSYLRMLPNMTILVPCDAHELELMMEFAYTLRTPVAIRYSRDTAVPSQLDGNHPEIGNTPFVVLSEGTEVVFVVLGPFVADVKTVADQYPGKVGVICLRFAKPLPVDELRQLLVVYKRVVFVEENVYRGSVSEELAASLACAAFSLSTVMVNLPDEFIPHDKRSVLLEKHGFSKTHYDALIRDALGEN